LLILARKIGRAENFEAPRGAANYILDCRFQKNERRRNIFLAAF
jgi:hypothetical protein